MRTPIGMSDNMTHPADLRLYRWLAASPVIAGLHGHLVPENPYGVLLCLGAHPLGLWSLKGSQYVFRDLANYEPCRTSIDLNSVHQQTVEMLTRCRHGWAEHFGNEQECNAVA